MIMGLLSILCSINPKLPHPVHKFYSLFSLTVCIVRTAKSPPTGEGWIQFFLTAISTRIVPPAARRPPSYQPMRVYSSPFT